MSKALRVSTSSSLNWLFSSITSFLKCISFFVSVPVLSDRIYSMRPSYSGMLLFLTVVPGISLSWFMLLE